MLGLFGLLTAVVATACFFKPGPPGGTSVDGGDSGSGGPDAPLPTEFGPFGTGAPLSLGPAGSYEDFEPSISDDGLLLVFASTREIGGVMRIRIWFVTRASTSAQFEMANVRPMDSVDDQYEPTVTPSGLDIYYVQAGGTPMFRRVSRPDTGSTTWTQATPISVPSVGPFDFVGTNVDHIIAGSTVMTNDPSSFVAEHVRTGGVSWAQRNVINSSDGSDLVPAIRADGLEVFFETITGPSYVTRRATRDRITDAFGPAQDFTISGFTHIGDPDLTADGEDLYFSAGSPHRIFVAHREPQ